MARDFPSGWSSGTVVDSTSGTDITELVGLDKSQETFKKTIKSSTGEDIIIASQPNGEYAVFYNQVSFNNLLYSVDAQGNESTGSAYNNQSIKTSIGGNAGLESIGTSVRQEVSTLVSTSLTPEEQSKIENENLQIENNTDIVVENVDPTDAELFEVTTKNFNSGGQYNDLFLKYPADMNSSQDLSLIHI